MTYLGGLTGLLVTGLLVFCLIDVLMTPEGAVRNLPKLGWVLIVLFFPLVGSIAWLVAGRPGVGDQVDLPYKGSRGRNPWPATTTAGFPEYERPRAARGPDDDPVFLHRLQEEKLRSEAEHEDMLRRWEADLRRREEELRRGSRDDEGTDGTGAGPDHGSR